MLLCTKRRDEFFFFFLEARCKTKPRASRGSCFKTNKRQEQMSKQEKSHKEKPNPSWDGELNVSDNRNMSTTSNSSVVFISPSSPSARMLQLASIRLLCLLIHAPHSEVRVREQACSEAMTQLSGRRTEVSLALLTRGPRTTAKGPNKPLEKVETSRRC